MRDQARLKIPRLNMTKGFSFRVAYAIPGYLLVIYALLLLSLGFFTGQRWESITVVSTAPSSNHRPAMSSHLAAAKLPTVVIPFPLAAHLPVKHPAPVINSIGQPAPAAQPDISGKMSGEASVPLAEDELPSLRYSAHIYASDTRKRSITLNGKHYYEGDLVVNGLVVEQIEQDMTVFDFRGNAFILEALEDWPGGKVSEDNTPAASEQSGE